jgi:threonine dehydrogenase-like Zn-dependent dehydrogenase
MRAVIWEGPNKLKYSTRIIPKPKKDEALVKILYNGLCTTDYEIVSGNVKDTKEGMVIGHEPVAQVIEKGESVDTVRIGDRVLLDTMIGCGECKACCNGHVELCRNSEEIGFTTEGCWSDYAVFPVKNLHPIPDSIGNEEATIIEALTCEMGGIKSLNINLGEHVFIVGSGLAMLIFVQLARLQGAASITVRMYDYPERVSLAKQFGADTIVSDDPYTSLESCKTVKTFGGFDKVIDAVCTESTLALSIQFARNGASILLYGLRSVTIDNFSISDVIFKNLTLYGRTSAPYFWTEAIELVDRGFIKLKLLVSEVIEFSDIIDIFKKEKEHGGPIKRVIRING